MGRPSEKLYIGIGGHIVAVDAASGEEVWRQKLKGSSFVTVRAEGKVVYAGAGGHLFCLDASTGEIRWRNPLTGLGVGVIDFGTGSTAVLAAAIAAAQAAAAAAST